MIYNKKISTFAENGKKITLFSLALPLFFENIFVLMYGTVNTYLLSGYSDIAVSATSVSNELISVVSVLINMVVSGTVIVSSFAIGSNNTERAGSICFTGISIVLFISLVFGIAMSANSSFLMRVMNLEGDVQKTAVEYFKIIAATLPVTAALSFFNNMLICNGYSKHTMAAGLIGNVLNVTFCYMILYVNLSLPFSKITGVAIASVLSRLINLIISIILFAKKRCPFKRIFSKKSVFGILRIGIPAGMCLFSYSLSQTVTTSIVATLGVTVISAKVYITNIINYTSKMGYSIGNAGGILMGRYRGAGDFDSIKALFKQNIVIAMIFNVLLSIIAYIFHRPLLYMFTKDEQTIKLAGTIMFIDIFLEIGRAINNVAEIALNANGDVKTTLVFSVVTCWLFGVLLAYLLCITAGMGLIGLWIAFAINEIVKGTAYLFRWKTGKWKKFRI